MSVRIEHGDCLEVMQRLIDEGAEVDSVVTDAPYHLASILKRFGAKGAAPAKSDGPTGAYARASSGFMGQQWDGGDIAFQPKTWALMLQLLKPGGYLMAFSSPRTYHRMACAIEDAGFEIYDQVQWLYGSGFPKNHNLVKAARRLVLGPYLDPEGEPQTVSHMEAYLEQRGAGTALKPAQEPICLARKPLGRASILENVMAFGTGALNIDGCRVHADDAQGGKYQIKRFAPGASVNKTGQWKQDETFEGEMKCGRWPANVIHDEADEVMEAFGSFGERPSCMSPSNAAPEGVVLGGRRHQGNLPMDNGTAARFFYSAKADKTDRLGSKHPTVKPIDLMAYLCRLVTPPGAVVLDPFAGSGTTGMACLREGLSAILIEKEAEYVADIRRRIDHVSGADTPLFAEAAQ